MISSAMDRRFRLRPRFVVSARTRIMGWVLLLVLGALAIVTFVTWRLLISAIDARMDRALRVEVQEFTELTQPGVNPRTGERFSSVDELISEAMAYNIARSNEKFLGYINGQYWIQSRQQPGFPEVLANDGAFDRLVGSVTSRTEGSYLQSQLGEVRYLAVPVSLPGDPARGVIVAAYLADAEHAEADAAARLMLAAGATTMLLATLGAWLLAGRILRPLRDVADTARSITESELSQRIPARDDRGDELDDLVRTVNGMLDRLEAGVEAQRRFTDDAGHELRTPITIVRGHLEVLDRNDPDDVDTTIALVDDELERMNRMVSDLLLLARSEQPSFLQPEPTDVGALTRSAFQKTTQLAPRRFALQSVAEVTAVLDSQRITQALIALADNACRHTEAVDEICLGSDVSGQSLRFWVKDSGIGVDEKDRARIFERFARGSSGRNRSDGAGLGLNIVQAIAVAHGGRVELNSTAGQGATFTLVIPIGGVEQWRAS